ncbi:MAG: iron-containing alcohol dehydrogenase [Oscillospiraceae bacterium]|nr:iron-containing alcohol dehydrogenase [Oscillospiraceae bacterium]
MNNFRYYAPTCVEFGRGAADKAGEMVRQFGGTKALLHYGGGSVKRSGLLDRVVSSLDAAGVAHVELGGVVPNPRVSKVREGIELAKREGVDFLLAVGGGSVIDSAKAIGYGLVYDGDVWDLYEHKAVPQGSMPVGCVLTLAATGSEMSDSSVISNEENGKKRGVNNDLCRCRFALLDPELTFTVPPFQTASGCADIISHTMERYFWGAQGSEPTDSVAEGLMRAMLDASRRVMKNPTDYDARAAVMWAGSLSHNGLTGCGNGGRGRVGDWACHQLEHELSGMFDVTHGAGLAAIWEAWSSYVMPSAPGRFARFARNVMGVAEEDDEKAAKAGISAYKEFLREIGMPTNLRELGLTLSDEQLDRLAYNCSFERTRSIGSIRVLEEKDMREIYRMARG